MQNFSTFYVLLALEQLVTELKKMARAGSEAHTYYDIFSDVILYRDFYNCIGNKKQKQILSNINMYICTYVLYQTSVRNPHMLQCQSLFLFCTARCFYIHMCSVGQYC